MSNGVLVVSVDVLSVIVSVRDCWLLVICKNYLLLLYRFLRFVITVAVGW